MIDQLINLDTELFIYLNSLHNSFWDEVMYWVSTKRFWYPWYALLLILIYRRWGWRITLGIVLAVALLITISDLTASKVLKPWVQRFRPCKPEADLDYVVHLVRGHCGGKYGFASSHSANFFALGTFLSLLFRNKWLNVLFLGIAALVAYSRIYLGVHYPGDVIVGAMIGIAAAWFVYTLLNIGLQKFQLKL